MRTEAEVRKALAVGQAQAELADLRLTAAHKEGDATKIRWYADRLIMAAAGCQGMAWALGEETVRVADVLHALPKNPWAKGWMSRTEEERKAAVRKREQLRGAAAVVVDRWEKGDLRQLDGLFRAEAVRELDAALKALEA